MGQNVVGHDVLGQDEGNRLFVLYFYTEGYVTVKPPLNLGARVYQSIVFTQIVNHVHDCFIVSSLSFRYICTYTHLHAIPLNHVLRIY